MNIKPESLSQSLEKSLAPVYLVAGAEPLLVQECRDLVIRAARKHGFLDRKVYEADGKFDWESIASDGMEQSLFSTRKIIDVRLASGKPGQSGGKFFSEWVQAPDRDVMLIVSCETWGTALRNSRWASDLAAAGVLVEVWPVKPQELPAWLDRRMRAAGLMPGSDAVRLLASLVEGNLLAAQQEIDKLALLEPGGKVSADTIRRSVANNSRFDAFRLGECLLVGQTAEALKVASGLQRTDVPIQAVAGALYYQLGQLSSLHGAMRGGENESRAFGRLRIVKMAQPAFRAALRRLGDRQIGDSFRALALIDRQSKGRAAGDPWQTLDRMLVDLCATGASGSVTAQTAP